jgi:hypothetical protein
MRALLAATLALLALSTGAARVAPPGPTVYSSRADDSWNRIFALLFTRTIRVSPFPAGEPFDRYEEGDRAIEALEPSFITRRGTDYILVEPARSELLAALRQALDERTPRPALDRALMQSDLWSAFDALAARQSPTRHAPTPDAAQLLAPLASLITKIALTPAEIAALPDNYAAARRSHGLPDLFAPNSGWIEVVASPHRLHDDAAQFRRASRVFVRPIVRPADVTLFLAALPEGPSASVHQAALLMQTLLIDSRGRVVPTRIVSDIQTRTITEEGRRGSSAYGDAIVHEYELSRRLLRAGTNGGLVHMGPDAPAFLPEAGNDYGFATPGHDSRGETPPRQTTLKGRCGSQCHGSDGASFMTFDLTQRLKVVALAQPNTDRARAVAVVKQSRDDFKRLIEAAGLRR